MRTKGKAIAQGLALGVVCLALAFPVAYFVLFAGFETPPNSADGQAGLAEFLRLLYSVGIAVICSILALGIAIWRLWPRDPN